MKNGQCKFGDKCKFKHTKEAVDSARQKYQSRKAAAVIAHNSDGEEGPFIYYTEHWIPEEPGTQEYTEYGEQDGSEWYDGYDYYTNNEWPYQEESHYHTAAAPALMYDGWGQQYYDENYENEEEEDQEDVYGQTDGEIEEEDEEEDHEGLTSQSEDDGWHDSGDEESSAESQA